MRKYSPEEEDGKEWAAERSVACRSNPSWQAAATALTLISMAAADFDPGRENDSCKKLGVGRNNNMRHLNLYVCCTISGFKQKLLTNETFEFVRMLP